MKGKFLFTVVAMIGCGCVAGAVEKEKVQLNDLVKVFERDPADPHTTVLLLEELERHGKPGNEVIEQYFKTQKEADYFQDYNWVIVRDYVEDIHAPQIRYIFDNQDKFIQKFSKDDVFRKLDNVLINYLEQLYLKDKGIHNLHLDKIKEFGYEHYDVIFDYFYIRKLRDERNAEDYFYKARKLFRYFPENRKMIKEITAGALEIMTDVSRLKVIQLWAGKTVESEMDFDAMYNYVLISHKCGYSDVARKYAGAANRLALRSNNLFMKLRVEALLKMLN